MKNTFEFLKKYALIIIATSILLLFAFQKCENKQVITQNDSVVQSDKDMSKADSLNTINANIQLDKKDSIIASLNVKLFNEKANTKNQKADANKQHVVNDSLQARFEREKNLDTCEDLANGLGLEISEKDSVIASLDSQVENYANETKELNDKAEIQSLVIASKQNLVTSKDSTIAYYKTQNKKNDLWNGVKIKAAGVLIIIETVALLLK
ncbi:MAG: hypothetical protein WCG93_15220 [Paludibacter sp.]